MSYGQVIIIIIIKVAIYHTPQYIDIELLLESEKCAVESICVHINQNNAEKFDYLDFNNTWISFYEIYFCFQTKNMQLMTRPSEQL